MREKKYFEEKTGINTTAEERNTAQWAVDELKHCNYEPRQVITSSVFHKGAMALGQYIALVDAFVEDGNLEALATMVGRSIGIERLADCKKLSSCSRTKIAYEVPSKAEIESLVNTWEQDPKSMISLVMCNVEKTGFYDEIPQRIYSLPADTVSKNVQHAGVEDITR